MKLEIRAPELSESVTTGTLLSWRRQVGEKVLRDETLIDLETDKVILEVAAPADGVLIEQRHAEGDTVKAGEVLAVIETEADAAVIEPEPSKIKQAERAAPPQHKPPLSLDGRGAGGEGAPSRKVVASTPSATPPTQTPSPPKSETRPARPVSDSGPHRKKLPVIEKEGRERRVPMSRLRQRIAERLVSAQHTAAILTTFNEVNMQPVNELRQRFKADFETRHGIKLGYMSFFVRAVCDALQQFPALNASIDGEDIVYHDYYDIGIAVSTPRGLVVPILRDAERLSFAEIEKGIADFAARAQTGALSIDELTGGTFSITNGGVFGSLLSTPILNPPQSGILGMHKIQERPVAENGQVVIRPMMYLALSYDHRLIDGKEAVQFLVAVKAALETPERLLLEV
ncbi:MAG: 2-oxoglutarate dehydrogenase complex dihydrolipoyllysine-residue succinyltransferase [Pseudomonadota bacterium]